jgi:serine/threonine protein phosphatase 1
MAFAKRLAALLGRGSDAAVGPEPERLTYAVADVHGRLDLLDQILELIEADRAGQAADIVFLGDYIDRGPASGQVLRRLMTLRLAGAEIRCLMGNHERMMLDFLSDPQRHGPRWLVNGGRETVESFLGKTWAAPAGEGYETAIRDALQGAAGPELLGWINRLALSWRSGDLACVHAITDPVAGWEEQTEATLLWGRPQPNMPARADGLWVVHGHTVVDHVQMHNRRIALDTGAYRSGNLSAARFEAGNVSLLTATGPAA